MQLIKIDNLIIIKTSYIKPTSYFLFTLYHLVD